MPNVTVEIPDPLRTFTGGRERLAVDAPTVGEALSELAQRYPGLGRRILDGDGTLRRHVNVFVGTEEIRALDGVDTPVRDGDVVAIIPAVAGG